jgi:hypothetical protein
MLAAVDLKTYFEPFDITYDEVTRIILRRAQVIPNQRENRWLRILVDGFLAERDRWNVNGPCGQYFENCEQYLPKGPIPRLAAGAFLHISYDLPRVLADNWPGKPDSAMLGEERGEWVYFYLSPVFLQAFGTVARNRRVAGWMSALVRVVPSGALGMVAHWALHLRTAAWIHARKLQGLPQRDREIREDAMATAMAGAVTHARTLPSISTLGPPHLTGVGLGALTLTGFPPWWMSIGIVAMVIALLVAFGLRRRSQVRSFIDNFASRVLEYAAVAVDNPEGLESYLRERGPRETPKIDTRLKPVT